MGCAAVEEALVGWGVEAKIVVRIEKAGVKEDVLVRGLAHLAAEWTGRVAHDLDVEAFGDESVTLLVI